MTGVNALSADLLLGRSPVDLMCPWPSRRRSRRNVPRVAFSVSSLQSAITRLTCSGSFFRTLTGGTSPITGAIDVTAGRTWALGTAADQFSQPLTTTVSIAGAGTNNFDLSGVMTSVVGDATATLTGIKFILVELISTTQDSTNGTACSSITIGNHATAAWVAPFGATGTYTIKNGGWWAHEEPTAAGVAVTATTADLLKIVNNDAVVSAYVRITILGIP